MKRPRFFNLLAISLGFVTFLRAEEAIPLTISITRTERPARGAPVSVTVMDQDAIEEAPATTPDNLLRNVPGLLLPGTNSTVSPLTNNGASIRGSGVNRVLVLEDGVPLNHSFGGWINWRRIGLEDLDRIEVARGGASSLFGNYAMGGVIYLKTRDPLTKSLEVEAGGGSLNTKQTAFYASNAGKHGGLSLSGDYFDTDGYNTVHPDNRGPIFTRAGEHHANLALKALTGEPGHTQWTTQASYFDGDQNLGTPLDNNTLRNFTVSTRVNAPVAEHAELSGLVYGQSDSFETDNSDLSPTLDAQTLTEHHNTPSEDAGAQVQFRHNLSGWFRFYALGMDGRYTHGEDKETRFDPAGAVTLNRETEGKQSTWSFFEEFSIFPLERLELLFSGRADHWQNTGERRDNPGVSTDLPSRSETQFSPRLAARCWLGGPVAMRAAAYRSFRGPTIDELYREKSFAGLTFNANPLLGPETLTGAETGFDVTTEKVSVQITGFLNTISDPITTIFAAPASFDRVNLGETRTDGVETIVDLFLTPQWSAGCSYVYMESWITDFSADPSLVGHSLPDIPKNTVTGSLRYKQRSWTAMVRGRYLSSQMADTSNVDETGAAAVFDAAVRVFLGNNWEAHVIGENIFDRLYLARKVGGFGITGAPRQVTAGVTFRFSPSPSTTPSTP